MTTISRIRTRAVRETLDYIKTHLVEINEKVEALARGTGDVTEVAAQARAAGGGSLPERIEATLRERPMDIAELTRVLGAPAGRVSAQLKRLRAGRHVRNVGTSTDPRWAWVVGDSGPTVDLMSVVEGLLRARPMTLRELERATGARRNRLSGVLWRLRRDGRVVNKGNGQTALWGAP